MVDAWQDDMASAEIDHIITCTWRDDMSQAALYEQGRTVPGPRVDADHPLGHIVTNAKPGQSAHQHRLALNFLIIDHGKPDWSGNSPAWDKAIALAEARGLRSLRPMESAHLEHPDWRQLSGTTLI